MEEWKEMLRYYGKEWILDIAEKSTRLDEKNKQFTPLFLESEFILDWELVWRSGLIAKRVSFLMKQGVFFGEAMPLAEERTVRYPAFLEKREKKQRSVIKKMAFAAQRLASKQALSFINVLIIFYRSH